MAEPGKYRDKVTGKVHVIPGPDAPATYRVRDRVTGDVHEVSDSAPAPFEAVQRDPGELSESGIDPEALARGAGQGATMNWGEEAAAAMVNAMPNPEGYNPAERPGSEAAMLEMMRTENRESRERSPGSYITGEVIGAAPLVGAAGSALPRAATMGARTAVGAGEGTLIGGAAGSGAATEGQRLEGGAAGATVGGLTGGMLPAVTGSVAGTASGLATGAKRVADRARAGATGMYGGAAKQYAREHGRGSIEKLGATVEKMGLHEGKGPLRALPQSWETYADNAAARKAQAGTQIGELADIAEASGARVRFGEIGSDLMDEAARLRGLPDKAAHAEADELARQAAEFGMESRVTGIPYKKAWEFRQWLDDRAFTAERALQSDVAKRARRVSDKLRGKLLDSLKEADPALRDAMAEANEAYAESLRLGRYADERLAQEAGNQQLSLPAMVAAGGGFAGGGAAGAVGGAVGGQLMKTRGASAVAGTARGVQRAAETVAAAARPVASSAAVPALASRSAVSMSDAVQQLARSNPAALGPHGPDLARAAQEGNFEVVHAIKMQSSQDYQDRLAGLEADHFEEN